jgi:hypothetical protein
MTGVKAPRNDASGAARMDSRLPSGKAAGLEHSPRRARDFAGMTEWREIRHPGISRSEISGIYKMKINGIANRFPIRAFGNDEGHNTSSPPPIRAFGND